MKENYKEITGNLQFKKNKMNILPNLPVFVFGVCSLQQNSRVGDNTGNSVARG